LRSFRYPDPFDKVTGLESHYIFYRLVLIYQHDFSGLLPAKRKARRANVQEELLRQILAELQMLNASLARNKPAARPGDNDEELEEYE
jgi:hypothetical protein